MDSKHSKALDGVRWFAFLVVFLCHSNERWFEYGRNGVQVFFVLSGFLIGRILLSMREQADVPLGRRLKVFYARRALRIFPVYYLVLALISLAAALHLTHVDRQHLIGWHLTYLTNIYMFVTGAKLDSHTHFWTLDVEEHFYLLAPLLILTLTVKQIEWSFVGLWIIVMIARLANYFVFHLPPYRFEFFSLMQFDILTVGIAAAIIERRGEFFKITAPPLITAGKVCGALLFAVIALSYTPWKLPALVDVLFLQWLLAISCAALVLGLWQGRFPALGRFLSTPAFVYLGKISYGLYLYHNFTMILLRHSSGGKRIVMTLVSLGISIVVASVSWRFFEHPINELKRLFPYPKSRPAPNVV